MRRRGGRRSLCRLPICDAPFGVHSIFWKRRLVPELTDGKDRPGPLTAKWDVFEAAFDGPATGNPFIEVSFRAIFSIGSRRVAVPGFYDDDGIYRVRFMPDEEGDWTYVTEANVDALAGHAGSVRCTPAERGFHGPVRVRSE